MPELPDIEAYADAITRLAAGSHLLRLHVGHPFLLRSVDPKPRDLELLTLKGVRRLAKRVVLAFESECYAVIHLMVAGRLQWRDTG
ncbi:MAG: formamidopyrimidine-DNA glycosylase, partial [Betaproteobacteria bacterium]|nr:formamidopyrimidine-DNA glycosylase [Betaproteobacteria bacterium]